MSKTIALVACVSKKYYSRLPARELYISPWFRKASTYGESIADEWYILSAKYGLLSPTTIIEPYDETMNNMPVNERRSWAEKVLVDLRQKGNPGDKLVILAGVKGGFGNTVMIDHGGGLVTLYAHQSGFAVSTGQTVSAGQVVGYCGSTGLSTSPHLHFEVRMGGDPKNPANYL